MKAIFTTLAIWLTLAVFSHGSSSMTENAFLAQFRKAIESKDIKSIEALTYQEGMSEKDKAIAKRAIEMLISNASEIEAVFISPLPNDLQTTVIMHGKQFEMTAPPAGVIEVRYKGNTLGGQTTSTPYAMVDGRYYLVGPRSLDLGWKGPPDKNIGFMVIGKGQDNAKITVSWNASGVNQAREFFEPSSTFWGQYIESILVTSNSEGAELTLSVMEEGKTIYTSKILEGKGTLEYKR